MFDEVRGNKTQKGYLHIQSKLCPFDQSQSQLRPADPGWALTLKTV